jgi:hypothetical protein
MLIFVNEFSIQLLTMKNTFPILLFVISIAWCNNQLTAQTATRSTLEIQRNPTVAARIEIPYSADIVESAIRQRLESATIKEERSKGMQIFKGARLTPTDGEVVDFYFKVNRKAASSELYLVLGRPNENVALRTQNDDYRVNDARRFLDQFVPFVAAHKLEIDISKQDELVKRAEKNLSNLASEQSYLEERLRELQDKLAQNRREQEKQTDDLNKQRTLRDALIARRASPSQ